MKIILKTVLLLLLLSSFYGNEKSGKGRFINTVNGKINMERLNFSLTHEHIMSNFGAKQSYFANYDTVALYNQVVPYLNKVKSQGVATIFDCTAAYFGRDVKRLKAIADATGIQIVTNTGFYGAANDQYVPELAYRLPEKEIAQIWIKEFRNGIDQTKIKPGFIKLGFDDGEPSAIDVKLFKAGILTHLKTGLTIVVHTGNNPKAATKQLELLEEKKVSPNAWVWAHANNVQDLELLINAASKGAWISLDGVKESNIAEYVSKIEMFKSKKLLHKVLLSHDGNSFPRGGKIRQYDVIQTILIPRLNALGYTKEEINQLMVRNPQQAFMTRVRKAEKI